jgi:hypothetical protein
MLQQEASDKIGGPVPLLEPMGKSAAVNDSEKMLENISPSLISGELPSIRCRRCGRILTSAKSQKQGYGDVCLRKVRDEDLKKLHDAEDQEHIYPDQAPGQNAPSVHRRPIITEEPIAVLAGALS